MKKIVLIEDNEDIRETTKEILELANYEILTAQNGKEGVELVKKEVPDLVICDVMMPDLDGYSVIRILSRNPETSTVPFIFLTAKSEKSDVRKGMNLGADDYITKPFDETELLESIDLRIKRNEALKNQILNSHNSQGLFGSNALKELEGLSKNRKVKKYNKKEVIYREDDYANYLYYVEKGKVKCFRSDDFGKELVNDLKAEKEFFGYMALFENGNYHDTAVAIEATELSIVPKQDFLDLVSNNREVTNNFIKILSGNVRDREEKMLRLAYAPLRERVANALVTLFDKEKDKKLPVTVKISREDLACMVGTAKESLVRALSEFKKEQLIDTDGQNIIYQDLEGIRKTATGKI